MCVFCKYFSTAISFEDDNNQGSSKEQIVENIRLHKEVLQSVKYQSWSIRRKLRLVRQAKSYVAKHEGALQERFAQSRATGALWARFKLLITAVSKLNLPDQFIRENYIYNILSYTFNAENATHSS